MYLDSGHACRRKICQTDQFQVNVLNQQLAITGPNVHPRNDGSDIGHVTMDKSDWQCHIRQEAIECLTLEGKPILPR
jgi:hypothetical protein